MSECTRSTWCGTFLAFPWTFAGTGTEHTTLKKISRWHLLPHSLPYFCMLLIFLFSYVFPLYPLWLAWCAPIWPLTTQDHSFNNAGVHTMLWGATTLSVLSITFSHGLGSKYFFFLGCKDAPFDIESSGRPGIVYWSEYLVPLPSSPCTSLRGPMRRVKLSHCSK